MTPQLTFRRFSSPTDEGWRETMTLYESAFPAKERRSEEDTVRALSDPEFHAYSVWQEGEFVALLFYWQNENLTYGEFLAVRPELRGQHIGQRIMEWFREQGDLIFEIEPPVDELTCRRRGFYERLGFVTNDYHYIHPSYGTPLAPHPLVLMSRHHPISRERAVELAAYVRERVMRYSHNPNPANPVIE